jgi:methylase of polypeptide subunit release factors
VPRETLTFGPLAVTFDERVLRPRPWTMLQASWAADLAGELVAGPILELCSGAGHIGQAASALTGRTLVQVDVDPHACALAESNAVANRHAHRVDVRCGELDAVLGSDERFPLVLADPPYLPRDEVDAWPDDPVGAIDGGPDGLDLARRCLDVAATHVRDGGVVLLQALGRTQIEQLTDDLDLAGLELVEVRAVDERRAVALLRPVDVRDGRWPWGAASSGCGDRPFDLEAAPV